MKGPTAKSLSQQTLSGGSLRDSDLKEYGFRRSPGSQFPDGADRYVREEDGSNVWLRTAPRQAP